MEYRIYPKARSENLVIQTVSNETLVYDLTSYKAHCLNETSAFVWSVCSGDTSIDDIARSIEVRFGQSVDADFVRLALSQLNERNLLSETGPDVLPMQDRRSAIRKIGLASAIAIPAIASMVTPANALGTVSCTGCTSPGQCAVRPGCGNFCGASGNCDPIP